MAPQSTGPAMEQIAEAMAHGPPPARIGVLQRPDRSTSHGTTAATTRPILETQAATHTKLQLRG